MTRNDIIKENEKQELKRPITGVIQEDRIWEQWYDQKKMQEDLPKMNQADYVFKLVKVMLLQQLLYQLLSY